MARDVFPNTMNTWIDKAIGRGDLGRRDLNAYLMGTYAEPLRIYYLGTNSRWLGEPDDIIGGFFASRLAQPEFFGKWRASGLRLRRWLMNGLCFYLQELKRERRRGAKTGEEAEEAVTYSGDPHADVDRAAVIAFVRQAMEDAERDCRGDGLDEHWRIFVRHHIDGIPFADLTGEFGVDKARAAVMSRTATRKFRNALTEILLRDGVPEDEINREIDGLLEAAG